MKFAISAAALFLLMALLLVTGCSERGQQIPEFPMQALASEHAVKGKLYLAADGAVEKYTVYVTRDGVPDWVHQMADEKLGKGTDESYEVELYADGSEVYEVRRTVEGRSLELSVKRDRTLKYIERQLDETDLPEPVRATVRNVTDFSAERYAIKEGPGLSEYQIRGKIGDVDHRVRVRKDGHLVAVQRQLPGAFEIAVRR